MIIQLIKGGSLKIKPSRIAEPSNNIYIKYIYESSLTTHLLPCVTINGKEYRGNNIYIDDVFAKEDIYNISVRLLDANNQEVQTYAGKLPVWDFYVFGALVNTSDFYKEIIKLRREIKVLEAKVEVLDNIGEVI